MTLKSNINIRLATEGDVQLIMGMNNQWITEDPNKIDRSNGYLNVDPFDRNDLIKIIENKELIIAEDQDKIVGYYLFDNFSSTKYLEQHKALIKDCIDEGLLTSDQKISLRMQCVIDSDYQNQNLSKRMLKALLIETKDKYDVCFASVSTDNPKYKAHVKIGWEALKKVDELILLVYKP
tara:strand:+ start:401 stop:937 length:537 start_codon:yes stop_codon:yes gene_type:complete